MKCISTCWQHQPCFQQIVRPTSEPSVWRIVNTTLLTAHTCYQKHNLPGGGENSRNNDNELPAAGRCHQGSWAARSTLGHCPKRGAAGPLWSCRAMMSPCNRWAGEERGKEQEDISLPLSNIYSTYCIFKQSRRRKRHLFFTGSQLERQKETYPRLTCPG